MNSDHTAVMQYGHCAATSDRFRVTCDIYAVTSDYYAVTCDLYGVIAITFIV